MQAKMIVTDLDGTLLHTDKTVSKYAVEVFKRCKEQGIIIAFATGRSEWGIARLELFAPDILISSGGALARYGDRILHRELLTSDMANALLKEFRQFPQIRIIDAFTENQWIDYDGADIDCFACGVFHITVAADDRQIVQKIAEKHQSVGLITFSDSPSWFRVMHVNANKRQAVEAAARHFHIPVTSIVAFGDDFNDVEMLKACGVGVAVANAVEEAKAAADQVCGNNDEDGPAKWIWESMFQGAILDKV